MTADDPKKPRINKRSASNKKDDASAREESVIISANQDLETVKREAKIERIKRDNYRDGHLNIMLIIGLWMIGITAAIIFLVLVAHKLKPDLWLNTEQVNDLQNFLFSGGAGAFLGGGIKKYKRKK